MKKVIGYLGPKGTYSHEAAMYVGSGCNLLALESSKFAQALNDKKIQQAVLPVVNAINWQVSWVLDLFMSNTSGYEITREIIWDIRSHLIGFGRLEDIKLVYSHSQPLGQCKGFLGKMSGVKTQETDSTAAAVKLVADFKDPHLAAIGTDHAARLYGVPVIKGCISDHQENQTRFVILGGKKSAPTFNNKTTLLFGTTNKPGALLRVLEIFDALDINMSDLFSMPSPNRRLGECFFLVDVAGHRRDSDLSVALGKIRKRTESLKILGSYPVATCAANVS